jgi:GNAT superfamily N-acetyltransferase
MKVRTAGIEDVADLARLRALWREHELTPAFVDALRDWMEREHDSRWWWVAETDTGEAVGMVNVKIFDRMPSPGRPPSRWGYLANLYVVAEHRRGGTGGLLVEAVIARARAEGLVRLVLAPSEQAMQLYARFGFRTARELLLRPMDVRPGLPHR